MGSPTQHPRVISLAVAGNAGRDHTVTVTGDYVTCSCPAMRNQRAESVGGLCAHAEMAQRMVDSPAHTAFERIVSLYLAMPLEQRCLKYVREMEETARMGLEVSRKLVEEKLSALERALDERTDDEITAAAVADFNLSTSRGKDYSAADKARLRALDEADALRQLGGSVDGITVRRP